MDVNVTLHTKQMKAAFQSLERSVQRRALRYATDAAAGVIKKALQASAPVRSGATKRSIRVKKVKIRGGEKRVIGPSMKEFSLRRTKKGRVRVATKKTAAQAFGKHVPGRVAHLVEFGHGGPHRAAPHPWMQPAFKSSVGAARAKMASKLQSEIMKGAERAAAKAR